MHERCEHTCNEVRKQLQWPKEAHKQEPSPDSHALDGDDCGHVACLVQIPCVVLYGEQWFTVLRSNAIAH
jgi:hypothetical protein